MIYLRANVRLSRNSITVEEGATVYEIFQIGIARRVAFENPPVRDELPFLTSQSEMFSFDSIDQSNVTFLNDWNFEHNSGEKFEIGSNA